MLNLWRTFCRCVENEFQRIPSLICLLPLMLGIVVSGYLPSFVWMVSIASLAVTIGILLLLYNRRSETALRMMPYCIGASFLFFGVAYTQARSGQIVSSHGKCICSGYVDRVVRDADGRYNVVVHADTLFVESLAYTDIDGYVCVMDSDCSVRPGDVVGFNGYVAELDDFSVLDRHRCSFLAYAYEVKEHDGHVVTLSTAIGSFRESIGDRLVASGLSPSNAGLVCALLVGDRSRLGKRTNQLFSDCGIVHLLAVSGLHVGIVYGFLLFVLGRIGKRFRFLSVFIVLLSVWVYAVLCGLSPSVFRASLMLSLYELSKLLNYKARVSNVLAVSALIILLADPFSLYSIGFWLSFAAVWGIVSFVPFYQMLLPRSWVKVDGDVWTCRGDWYGMSMFRSAEVWKGRLRWILRNSLGACVVSVIAQVVTAPLSLLFFHRFPTYFLFNNILFVALVAPVLVLSAFTVALGGYVPCGILLDGLLSFMVDVAGATSSWPMSVVDDVCWTWYEALLAMFSLFALSRYRYKFGAKPLDMAHLCVASVTLFLCCWFIHLSIA